MEFPTTPPTIGTGQPNPYGTMPVAGEVHRATEPEESRSSYRRGVMAGLAVAGLLGVSAIAVSCGKGESAPNTPDPEAAAAAESGTETCPNGMFPNGAYEAQKDRLAANNELHTRPANDLTDTPALLNYMFGKQGVACESAPSLAVVTALNIDLLGAGNAGTGFKTTDIEELESDLVKDPGQAKIAADVAKRLFSASQLNEAVKKGPMFRVSAKRSGDEAHPYTVFYTPESVDFAPQTGFILTPELVAGDGTTQGLNQSQVIFVDKKTGQIYVAKAIGAPVVEKQDKSQADVPADQQEQGGGSGSNTHGEDSIGGSSNTAGENSAADGETNGCDGSCGSTGGGGGHNGGGGSGGCGGGCGGGSSNPTSPTQPPTTRPPATNPPTTRPPATTPPPTTRPPATTPPPTTPPPTTTTTPTTPPPTTTTTPKGPDPGCHPPAPCE